MLAPSKYNEYLRRAARCEWWSKHANDSQARNGYMLLAKEWRQMAEQEKKKAFPGDVE
jgi:hypothetical protein